jgi:hypothetical protein
VILIKMYHIIVYNLISYYIILKSDLKKMYHINIYKFKSDYIILKSDLKKNVRYIHISS